ncbi:PP2C family protein-serine/threonine phosphatase [candidate division KSB1 bacterium]|nr:PP2C family protein-serine/threonine phosphatase [candidate division KSB1 bacterium]
MSKIQKHIDMLKRAYHLYLSGLNRPEIEHLLKRDTPDVYSFYSKGIQSPSKADLKKPRTILRFAKELFISFLLKLSPARRVFYILAFCLFGWGLIFNMVYHIVLGFLILNILLALELADKLKTKDELEFAREIQLSLLPRLPSKIGMLRFAGFMETALEVGGDYYDLYRLEDGRILLIIGDVSGKGIAAALYMVRLQGFMGMLVSQTQSPREILCKMNQLCNAQLKRNFFVTLTIALIDPNSMEMQICRAGHNPLIYFRQLAQRCLSIEPRGLALGLENNGLFEKSLEEVKLALQPGDLIFMYTDGLNETRNAKLEEFGERRIADIICHHHAKPPDQLQTLLLQEVTKFRAHHSAHDDLTFVIVQAGA